MAFLRLGIAVFALALLTGCLSPSFTNEGQTMTTEHVIAACRERWGWGAEAEAFGLPAVALTRLNHPMISALLPGAVVYRVTRVNKAFVFGSGPKTKTATCLVEGNSISFLETDDDVLDALPSFGPTSLDGAVVLDLLGLFAKLRGLELQVGPPSQENPWAVMAEDGRYPVLKRPSEQDPARWTVVLGRSGDIWTVEGTLVSPDDFRCRRYAIRITGAGRIEIQGTEEVFSIGTFL